MFNYITNLLNSQKLYRTLLFLFLFSLLFPIRHVFLTHSSYLSGQYSDFASFSLYLSDILLFLLFGLIMYLNFRLNTSFFRFNAYSLMLIAFIFWLILALILHFSNTTLFWTLKWFEFIVAYGTVQLVLSEKGKENWIEQGLAGIFVGF
jgi:hypothetical protein